MTFQFLVYPGFADILDSLPSHQRHHYAHDFHVADAGYHIGRVEATATHQAVHWRNWEAYVKHVGVDPYLQNTPYRTRVRVLTGFAARVRSGGFGCSQQAAVRTVTTALSAIGATISLVFDNNPTKVWGTNHFLPQISQMLDGWKRKDPTTQKKLPIEVDIPNHIASDAWKHPTSQDTPKECQPI